MHPRRPWPAGDVCWKCRLRIARQHRPLSRSARSREGIAHTAPPQLLQRPFHATQLRFHTASATARPASSAVHPGLLNSPTQPQLHVRQRLQLWQQEFGGPDEDSLRAFENYPSPGDIQNTLSKLSHGAKSDEHLSEAKLDAYEDDAGEDLVTIGLFLKPGDVVELSMPDREPVLAVFVQQIDLLSQFFSVNGRWCHSQLATITFAVPGCIDRTLVQSLRPYMPTKPAEAAPKEPIPVPRDISGPIQAVLRQLTEDAERIYRTNAPVLDSAYSALADSSRTRMMTLAQIAKTLLSKSDPAWVPSPAALLAVRKALNHNVFRFRAESHARLTNVIAIRPKNDVQVVETVHEWIREHRECEAALANGDTESAYKRSEGATHVANFVNKARRLIAISRRHREPNPGFIGPSKARSATDRTPAMQALWGEDFTKTDRQIIDFLQAWVLTAQFHRMPALHSACTSILHATGCYEDMASTSESASKNMGATTGQLFLQEIGVITPHENRLIYDEQLMLPTVRLSRNLELLNARAELTRRNPDFRDSMAHLRRDWGSIPVYCIDDANAQEIDDGISIERVRGEDSEYWVHIHVANPTAFFDKTHVLSGLAAHMTQTVYIPERTFPMLPTWTTQNYFSLARNRPVITFSSRVDRSGNLVESKIQHGIIRKIVTITPTQLSAFLGENTTQEVKTRLVVGGDVPPSDTNRTLPNLPSDQRQDLQYLYTVARALWQRRKATGGVRQTRRECDVRLFESPHQAGLAWTPPSKEKARLIQGDPIIEVTGTGTGGGSTVLFHDIDSHGIVEEIMMLACRVAASFCGKRNIPAMFRGTITPPSQSLSLEDFQQQVVFPHLEKHGSLSQAIAFQYVEALGRAITHTSPIPHRALGLPGYVKVTSPLRRFSDMIAHWQIEAALRHEARTGQQLSSAILQNAPRSILPFSQRQMQDSIITLSPRESIIRRTQMKSKEFWVVHAFMRAFHFKEASLPDTFIALVRSVHPKGYVAYLDDLNVKVIMKAPDQAVEVGDSWEVKIEHVNTFMRFIWVTPIRMLHRELEVV